MMFSLVVIWRFSNFQIGNCAVRFDRFTYHKISWIGQMKHRHFTIANWLSVGARCLNTYVRAFVNFAASNTFITAT